MLFTVYDMRVAHVEMVELEVVPEGLIQMVADILPGLPVHQVDMVDDNFISLLLPSDVHHLKELDGDQISEQNLRWNFIRNSLERLGDKLSNKLE